MKIKSVCELTGLTDRTIRYYIEEKLISPLYTENYLGRKTYNFSEKDIKDLNDIAVLRKFDFTLDEIKSVINDAETSKEILSNVKDRTAQTVLDSQNKLSVLSQINTEKIYTVAELADVLSKVSLDVSFDAAVHKPCPFGVYNSLGNSLLVNLEMYPHVFEVAEEPPVLEPPSKYLP